MEGLRASARRFRWALIAVVAIPLVGAAATGRGDQLLTTGAVSVAVTVLVILVGARFGIRIVASAERAGAAALGEPLAPATMPRSALLAKSERDAQPSAVPAPAAAVRGGAWIAGGGRLAMDEVHYRPGAPNVLSMTKLIAPDGARAAAPTCAAAVAMERAADRGEAVVRIAGTLDAASAPSVRMQIQALAADACGAIVLDLAGLEHIDSAGVRLIVTLIKAAEAAQGTVRLTGAAGQPLAVLRLLRLERFLSIA
jgi:anti-anti-sigma factor